MYEWEQNPDAWKGESKKYKPGEDADAWKGGEADGGETKKDPRVSRVILAYTVGIRPMVDTTLVKNAEDLQIEDRDALKLVSALANGQKATTKEGELFEYSVERNMWVKIPWEKP